MEEKQIIDGLAKLEQAAQGVALMKKDLAVQEEQVRKMTEQTNELLKTLEKENEKADKKAKEVGLLTENCQAMKDEIAAQEAIAQKELAEALPY